MIIFKFNLKFLFLLILFLNFYLDGYCQIFKYSIKSDLPIQINGNSYTNFIKVYSVYFSRNYKLFEVEEHSYSYINSTLKNDSLYFKYYLQVNEMSELLKVDNFEISTEIKKYSEFVKENGYYNCDFFDELDYSLIVNKKFIHNKLVGITFTDKFPKSFSYPDKTHYKFCKDFKSKIEFKISEKLQKKLNKNICEVIMTYNEQKYPSDNFVSPKRVMNMKIWQDYNVKPEIIKFFKSLPKNLSNKSKL